LVIHETFAREIKEVRASLIFSGFRENPDEITAALGVPPDNVRREKEMRTLPNGRQFRVPENLWVLDSRGLSKDVNVLIREPLSRLVGREEAVDPSWNPSINVLWKSRTLGVGAGPYYESHVMKGMARIGADLFQDLYSVEDDREEWISKRGPE